MKKWIWLLWLLFASPAIAGQATLSWDPPTTNTDGTLLTDLGGYKAYYGASSGIYGSIIDTGNVITYTVTDLAPGTYYFAVTAYDTTGNESDFSNEVSKTIVTIPAPVALQAVGDGGTVTLSWDKPNYTDIAGYQISRGTSAGLYNTFYVVGAAQTSLVPCVVSYTGCVRKQHIWYNTPPGTYYFTVRGYDSQGAPGAYAGGVSVTLSTDAVLPADVTNFTAAKLSDTSIRLTWTNPSDPDFSGLKIEYAFNNTTSYILLTSLKGYPGAQQAYNHYNLIPGTHNYRIHSYDTSGNMTSTKYASTTFVDKATLEITAEPESTPAIQPAPQKREKSSKGFGCGTITNTKPPDDKGGPDASILMLAAMALLFKFRNKKTLAIALSSLCLVLLAPKYSNGGTITVPLSEYPLIASYRIYVLSPKSGYSAVYTVSALSKAEFLDEVNARCTTTYRMQPRDFTLYGLSLGEYYIAITDNYQSHAPPKTIKRTIKQSRDPSNITASGNSGIIKIDWDAPPDIQPTKSMIEYSYNGGPFHNSSTLTTTGEQHHYTAINKPPSKYIYRITFLDNDIIVGAAETTVTLK